MAALLVYGSLINKNELLDKNIDLLDCIPVKVYNLKREFSQEPSWRKSEGDDRAVLRVDIKKKHFINALLVQNIKNKAIKDLDHRERGYDRIKVEKTDIEFCYDMNKKRLELSEQVYIYIGKCDKLNPLILPNPHYLDICLEGAKQWGDRFYKDFIESTYVKDRTLRSIL